MTLVVITQNTLYVQTVVWEPSSFQHNLVEIPNYFTFTTICCTICSGTLKYVKMKKKMSKIMNIMKTYGPHSSCNSQRKKVNSDIVHTF